MQALNGIGGIGKTQTAVEYAYRFREDYQFVLWASANTRDLLVKDCVAIAAMLDLPEKAAQDQDEAVNAVKRWLEGNAGWLLILDNADDLKVAREFIPSSERGHVLLTTRAQVTGTIAVRNAVDKMEPPEGATFLLRRLGKLKKDEPLESVAEQLRTEAEDLSKELGGLPLALDQAAAFIDERNVNENVKVIQ
ncbi:MAG: NB-ARC domain-containing protein [Blastocatellales bacterium]